jgi:hypothetical protein
LKKSFLRLCDAGSEMFLCEAGGDKANSFDDLIVFVSQMNAVGETARILATSSLPEDASRNHQFDAAPYLTEEEHINGASLIIVGAHELTDEKLVRLRRLERSTAIRCVAIGRFRSLQNIISAKAKLSYVLGQDPEILNLEGCDAGVASTRCPVIGVPRRRAVAVEGQMPTLLIVAPNLKEQVEARALLSLAISRKIRAIVLTDGEAKQAWTKAHGYNVRIYHYGELLPASLASQVDICATFARPSSNYRMKSLIANLAVSGCALIDCTSGHQNAKQSDVYIEGPPDLSSLGAYLVNEILPSDHEIRDFTLATKHAKAVDARKTIEVLKRDPGAPPSVISSRNIKDQVVFVPTNGVGLGHAQRCSLVASEIDKTVVSPVFAAFPSCAKMLKSYGFDVMPLISRSRLHAQEHENDLVNYTRLRALTAQARALVFDGGYVFDSIYRSILDNGLSGIWIRRGLWQGAQDNSIALDREKVFDRVIVPMEAFDELNESYSRGSHVHAVGPIVRQSMLSEESRVQLRAELAQRYEREFSRLVVTMLGGGVAADRKAQTQAICGMIERRPDTLHLVVVWPTATIESSLFTWDNSRVVTTHHASALVAAADLYISAAGYNSFHEVIYNAVPTIFMPQMSVFMDDQRARALAAVDRGLASVVEPHEMLALDLEISRFLDGGKSEEIRSKLADVSLPQPGNSAAASLIEEMACEQ